MDFWIRAAQLILSLSILIVLHEFGHFIPARLFKTRVEKFYLFFDPYFALFKKKIGDTEWGIGWLPLGGYVKISGMVDESMDKEQLALPPQPWEFRSKPAWQRLIVMLGGVTVNVIVGFVIFILVLFVWGEDKVDQKKLHHGMAVHPYLEQFGFESGDRVLIVDGVKNEDVQRLGGEILIFDKRHFTVQHQNGKIEQINLPEDIGTKMWTNDVEKSAFDLRRFMGPVKSVDPKKGTAKRIGIKKGDKIVAINDQEIEYYDQFQSALYHNKGKKVTLTIERKGATITKETKIGKDGFFGISGDHKYTQDTSAIFTQKYSFGESFSSGFGWGLKMMYSNVAQFKYVFTKKGASSVGGFGAIGQLFPTTWDWQAFWKLTAILSMMLAVMNLLPIPALDGGHVMFLLYEIITGRAASQNVMEKAQYVGFFLLIGLLLFANGNDLIKWLFG